MMKKLFPCAVLLLALALPVSASALEVPVDTVVQNLNGSQQVIKTYALSPETDPQKLIEEPFVLEGYRYVFADITKTENLVEDTAARRETVTVETEKKDLSTILEQLAPTLAYDDGTYRGTLALDHTSLQTEAAGYTSGRRTLTATKTIGPLDRNDMSYIPATTIQNGRTLTLSNVEWQVTGTDLVGEALVPSSYQAVATYSGNTSYSVATGYITTAEYVGDVSRSEVKSITYQVTYLGEEYSETGISSFFPSVSPYLPYLACGLALAAVIVLAVLLVRSRREAAQLCEGEPTDENDEQEDEAR